MPIKRQLRGSAFAPEHVAEIAEAYLGVIQALGIVDDPSKEEAARIVMGLASEQKTLEAARLRDDAILKLKASGIDFGRPAYWKRRAGEVRALLGGVDASDREKLEEIIAAYDELARRAAQHKD